jgi:hypothetical protein
MPPQHFIRPFIPQFPVCFISPVFWEWNSIARALLIFLSGLREVVYMSRLSDILSAGLCDRLEIEKRQETGKVFRGTRISFHLALLWCFRDAFILRKRMHQLQRTGNFFSIDRSAPSILISFWKSNRKKNSPMQRREKKWERTKTSNRNQE